MTNFEYIKNNITELDLAYYEFPHSTQRKNRPPLFIDKINEAWQNWAESASPNHGNMAKGNYNGKIISDNPSIWAWEEWYYPDGTWKKSGRNSIVSFLVWLSKQYNPDEWIIDDEF